MLDRPVVMAIPSKSKYKDGIRGKKNIKHVEKGSFYYGNGGARMNYPGELNLEYFNEKGKSETFNMLPIKGKIRRKRLSYNLAEELTDCVNQINDDNLKLDPQNPDSCEKFLEMTATQYNKTHNKSKKAGIHTEEENIATQDYCKCKKPFGPYTSAFCKEKKCGLCNKPIENTIGDFNEVITLHM